MPVIGFFHLTSLELKLEPLAAFHRGLGDNGYIEARTSRSNTGGHMATTIYCQLATKLVRRQAIRDRYPGKHTGCARSQSGDPDITVPPTLLARAHELIE